MYFTKANSNYWTDVLKVRNGNKTMKLRTQSLRSKTSKIKLARKIMDDSSYLVANFRNNQIQSKWVLILLLEYNYIHKKSVPN